MTDDLLYIDGLLALLGWRPGQRWKVYATPALRSRAIYPSGNRPQWRRSDIVLYLATLPQGIRARKPRTTRVA